MAPYPASNFASPSIDSVVVCGLFGLPTPDPVSVFHATSSPFPMLQPRLKASAVTTLPSVVVSKTSQTVCGAAHPLASY